jgi:hypothetical protein
LASRDAAFVARTNGPAAYGAISVARAWPFSAEDGTALAWWRMLPPDLLRDAEHLMVRATLDGITVLRGGDDFTAALRGDPAAAIAVAFSVMPIEQMTVEVDIAMTAVMQCALDGSPAAAFVLGYVIGCTELDHPFATELSASWDAHDLRQFRDRGRFAPAEAKVRSALRECDQTAAKPEGGQP